DGAATVLETRARCTSPGRAGRSGGDAHRGYLSANAGRYRERALDARVLVDGAQRGTVVRRHDDLCRSGAGAVVGTVRCRVNQWAADRGDNRRAGDGGARTVRGP